MIYSKEQGKYIESKIATQKEKQDLKKFKVVLVV